MPTSTFRIESVAIEGFKAFTKPQTFHFEGRHVFLFGPNGLGKTSIVEAIRWCLFGLASRPGEIVRNQFYVGPCIVQLTLSAPDGPWTMQRRLRSSGGDSDRTIRDPSGSERNLEDVFPQLSRLGPREGTHVIYAAQQPSNRRPEADITDFSYVVYRYLGLEEVPRLSDVLLALSADWKNQEDDILQEVGALGDSISERIAGVDASLNRIMSAPPWGNGLTPTTSDTRDTIDRLARDAEELGAKCSSEALKGLAPGDKLYEVETALKSYLSGEMTGLSQRYAKRSIEISQAESHLRGSQSVLGQIQEKSNTRDALQNDLDATLGATSIEELENQLQEVQGDLESRQLGLDVVRASLRYLEGVSDVTPLLLCPTCGSEIQLTELKPRLEAAKTTGDGTTNEILEQRDQISDRISRARQLLGRIEELDKGIVKQDKDLDGLVELAAQSLGLSAPSSIESLRKHVEELRKGLANLQNALASQGEAQRTWEAGIENARQELRFHELRELKERLQRLYEVRYEALHDSLKDLTELRDIAEETRGLINSGLQSRLSRDLPPVAQEMTDVYLRLTGSPTFDKVGIRQGVNAGGSMTLDLQVSSSQGLGTWGVEQGILNGQALNAIQLIPYFVFSRYQEGPLLDLLLLDDPTQAFDTEKISLLLTELANAASHATLFLATHEEEKFLPVLKGLFNPSDVRAYRAVSKDEDGPHFEDVPITL